MDEANQQQYLTFMLGNETYAAQILAIKELIEYGHLTVVPMLPPFIRGVINLRGRVVPVIDLQARFGKGHTTITRRTCIVILEVFSDEGRHDFGIIVDAVNQVIDIPRIEIEPPPSFGAGMTSRFIQGMRKVDGRFVVILDISRVLSADETVSLTDINEEALT